MKKLSGVLGLILACLIVYGGVGVNQFHFCCNTCSTHGVEAITDDCCNNSHDDSCCSDTHSDENECLHNENDKNNCCYVENVSHDWQTSTTINFDWSPSIFILPIQWSDFFVETNITKLQSNSLWLPAYVPLPRTYLSLLSSLLI